MNEQDSYQQVPNTQDAQAPYDPNQQQAANPQLTSQQVPPPPATYPPPPAYPPSAATPPAYQPPPSNYPAQPQAYTAQTYPPQNAAYPAPGQPGYGYMPQPPVRKSHTGRWVAIGAIALVLLGILISIPLIAIFRRVSAQSASLVQPLHQKMAAGDDYGIFNDSDPAYQAQVGPLKSNLLFDTIRRELGAPGASTFKGFDKSATSEDGQRITVQYDTQFTKGLGHETIVLHKMNGQYRLFSYSVKSPLLK